MNHNAKTKSGGSSSTLIAVLIVLACLGACQKPIDHDDVKKPGGASAATPLPAKISFENGQAILTLDQQTQSRMGIEFATLAAVVARPQVAVPAVVLSVQDLTTFRNSYIVTQAQIEKSRVNIDVARKEYARLKMLFDNNRNISEKTLESAGGRLRTLQVDERAAEQQSNLQISIAQQRWGNVVAKWTIDGSPELDRLLGRRKVLLQVTLPFEWKYNAPRNISLEIPGSARVEAVFLSPYPQVDPRIQGRSFLYEAPGRQDFSPGVNLLAHFEAGKPVRGVTIPASAVIWSEGKAWTYLQTAPNQFSRRALATDFPVDGGYFVRAGFSARSKVVSNGAQSLFSEESVLQGYGGGGDEN
ncbi:MAG TPA: efflux RND transporter periplasmic adaptor subunit [Candidatus Dormibacteraeota bacterium]|nr:efflux RND transporter periplasmic adaptor subunit [Candidatus Dormibacteraeota bacterium]